MYSLCVFLIFLLPYHFFVSFNSVTHCMVHCTKCDEIVVFKPKFFTCINRHSVVDLQVLMVVPSPGVVQIPYANLAEIIIALLDLSAFLLPCRSISKSRHLICFISVFTRLFITYIALIVDSPAILA